MRIAITQRTRAFLIAISAAAYVASLSDLSERLEARGLPPRIAIATPPADRGDGPFAASLVTRDPFDGAARRLASSPRVVAVAPDARRGLSSGDDVAAEIADEGDPGVLVPDIATGANVADVTVSSASRPLSVRATLIGSHHAAAYVADGEDLRLIHVGDVVDGRHVSAIDVRGIAFVDGTRVDLEENYRATPAPRATPRSRLDAVARELNRLRTTIERRRTAFAPVPEPSAQPAIKVPRHTPEPTAWPLPTVDSRGLPVGVNPTPDASGPTAYPYPYPYPPPGPHSR